MDSRLKELTGHELTIFIASGPPDGMGGIIKLLGFYAQGAVPYASPEPDASVVLHVELANRGLQNLSEIASLFRSWTELLDDFVLLAMDLKRREREPFEGRAPMARSANPTHRLITLFGALVPIEQLTMHVEWSCSDAVANIFRGARKFVRLTNYIKAWRQHNPNNRLLLLL